MFQSGRSHWFVVRAELRRLRVLVAPTTVAVEREKVLGVGTSGVNYAIGLTGLAGRGFGIWQKLGNLERAKGCDQ